jgi:hypothetical protein
LYQRVDCSLEKLASLPDAETFLKPGIPLAQLQAEATRLTDNQAAQQLNASVSIPQPTIQHFDLRSRRLADRERQWCRNFDTETGRDDVLLDAQSTLTSSWLSS